MLRKSINFIVVIVGVMIFLGPVNVFALTFDEVVEKIKVGELYKNLNNDEVSTLITKEDDKMTILYDAKESGTWVTEFNYANNIISYEFKGNKNNETTFSQVFIDMLWIKEIFNIVISHNGYSLKQIEKFEEEKIDTFSLEKNGIEMTDFKYYYQNSDSNSNVNISGEGCDTFKININELDLELNNSNENNDGNFDNIENPSTGINVPIISIIILISLNLITISLFKKKNKFNKI